MAKTKKKPGPKKHRYTWVPAGFDSLLRVVRMGVKKAPFKRGAFILNKDKTILRTEDRYIVTDKTKMENCDTVYKRGLWKDEDYKSNGLEIVMFNATYARQKQQPRDHGVDVLVDSGGFQLRSGRVMFLDPRKIAQRSNDVGTIAISLDLPVTPDEQRLLMPRLTQLQRRNNEMFKQVLEPGVDVMNVCHGFNLTARKAYLQGVWDPAFKRLAVAGLIGRPVQDILAHMIWLITTLEGRIKHYHMLGVSGGQIFFTLAYLNKLFPDVLITSDSSTYLMHAKNALLFDPASFSSLNFSKSEGSIRNQLSATMRMPCSCEFCVGIGHVMAALDGPSGLTNAWMFHNLREATRRVALINDVVHNSTDSEIIKFAASYNSNYTPVLTQGYMLANRLVHADKEQRLRMLQPWFRSSTSLFHRVVDDGSHIPQTKTGKRYAAILDKYEKFHAEHGIK